MEEEYLDFYKDLVEKYADLTRKLLAELKEQKQNYNKDELILNLMKLIKRLENEER